MNREELAAHLIRELHLDAVLAPPVAPWFTLRFKPTTKEEPMPLPPKEYTTPEPALSTRVAVLENDLVSVRNEAVRFANEAAEAKKALATERMSKAVTRSDDRALLVNLDGTTKNTTVYAGHHGLPKSEFTQIEMGPLPLRELTGIDYRPDPGYRHTRRTYRLAFSQGSLHVYQEIG